MILTCPECATGYFVEDDQIQAAGRAVRCASCGHRWTARPERPLELVSSDAEGALAREPTDDEPGLEPGALTGDELPKAFRSRAEEERRNRQAAVMGAVWTAVALVAVVVVGSAIVFREQMVRAWPQTASAYAAIGLPVNPTGLVIEDVQMEPSLELGHPTLVVSGSIRNVVGHGVMAPPLRISLLNAQGKRVAGQITDWTDRHVPPGAVRHFRTSIPDPPFSAASLQIDFAIGGRATAGDAQVSSPAQPPPTNIPLRGPAGESSPVNATPLPASAMPMPVTETPQPEPAPATNAAPMAR